MGANFGTTLTHGGVETPHMPVYRQVESTSVISALCVKLAGYSAGTSQNPPKPLFPRSFT